MSPISHGTSAQLMWRKWRAPRKRSLLANFHTAILLAIWPLLLFTAAPCFAQDSKETDATNSSDATRPKDNEQDTTKSAPAGNRTPWQILRDGLSDKNAERRSEALASLATIGPRKSVVHLVERALGDSDPSIRRLAATALGEMRARASIPELKTALDDDAPEVSFAAAKSLTMLGDGSGREVFMQILSGEKKSSTGLIKGQLDATKKKLQDPAKLAVVGAKEAAGSLFGPARLGIKLFEEATEDRSASARAMSAMLLAPNPSPDGFRHLQDALSDKNWVVRAAAAQALGTTQRRSQIRFLRPLLDDPKPAVRYMAAASMVRLASGAKTNRIAAPLYSANSVGQPALGPATSDASRAH
jgi:HEAT repeat protein